MIGRIGGMSGIAAMLALGGAFGSPRVDGVYDFRSKRTKPKSKLKPDALEKRRKANKRASKQRHSK